jgi:hypothetical protein
MAGKNPKTLATRSSKGGKTTAIWCMAIATTLAAFAAASEFAGCAHAGDVLPAQSDAKKRFPDTPVGRALQAHLLTLTDLTAGADARKQVSLAGLQQNPKEAAGNLMDAYRAAPKQEHFGRWMLSLTLAELKSPEAYSALREIATSEIRLESADPEKHELMNESAIRQSAVRGLAFLAKNGHSGAEQDLLDLALNPPSGEGAVRAMAIKGYLAAGGDYAVRVQTLLARLPAQYHGVVTLNVSRPSRPPVPIRPNPAKPSVPHALPPAQKGA